MTWVLDPSAPALIMFGLSGFGSFSLALFAMYRTLRRDQQLDSRVDKIERRVTRYQHRVYQLEAILRAHGIAVPPWTINPDDIDELGDQITAPHRRGDDP